jgi:hypothetical protein
MHNYARTNHSAWIATVMGASLTPSWISFDSLEMRFTVAAYLETCIIAHENQYSRCRGARAVKPLLANGVLLGGCDALHEASARR